MADEIKKTENAAEMDWDSGISADVGESNLPPVGEYGFTVTEFEKTISKSGKKMAKITLELDITGDGTWIPFRSFKVLGFCRHDLGDIRAYWVRAVADRDCKAFVQFWYE